MSRWNLFFLLLGLFVFILAGTFFVLQRMKPDLVSLQLNSLTQKTNLSTKQPLLGPRIEVSPEQNLVQNVQASTEKLLTTNTIPNTKISTPKGVKLLSLKITDELAEFDFNRAIVENGGGSYEALSTAILENAYSLIQGRQTIVRYPKLKFSFLIEGQPASEYYANYVKQTSESRPSATPLPTLSPISPTALNSPITPSQPGEL